MLYFHTDPTSAAASQANREEADLRSVFVGNVSTRKLYFSTFLLFLPLFSWEKVLCIMYGMLLWWESYLVLYSWTLKMCKLGLLLVLWDLIFWLTFIFFIVAMSLKKNHAVVSLWSCYFAWFYRALNFTYTDVTLYLSPLLPS